MGIMFERVSQRSPIECSLPVCTWNSRRVDLEQAELYEARALASTSGYTSPSFKVINSGIYYSTERTIRRGKPCTAMAIGFSGQLCFRPTGANECITPARMIIMPVDEDVWRCRCRARQALMFGDAVRSGT